MHSKLLEQALVGSVLSAFCDVYNCFGGFGLNETTFASFSITCARRLTVSDFYSTSVHVRTSRSS